eukprot:5804959-Pyramimonas_sp.AAC.1
MSHVAATSGESATRDALVLRVACADCVLRATEPAHPARSPTYPQSETGDTSECTICWSAFDATTTAIIPCCHHSHAACLAARRLQL